MEVQHRRPRAAHIQDQENLGAIKGKSNFSIPVKRQGLAVRGALGDLNTNIHVQTEIVGKVAVTTAEFEKKATLNRTVTRSNYSHVLSKIDTGLVTKNAVQPSSRPPLRREESTASLATRAAARTRAALKESQNKSNELKESINIFIQNKKCQELKKTKLPPVKEHKESKIKQVLKEPIESLGKLKLAETTVVPEEKSKGLINEEKLKNAEFIEFNINDSSSSLPEDIEDVDAEDEAKPSLMSIYIKDIYKYLYELEERYPIEPDHLSKQTVVTAKMRATLIDWLVEIQRQFVLLLDTLHLTVGIIDRYLQAVPNVQRNEIQLVGVTAMFIASKYEEIHPPDVGDFVYVTANAYAKADIFQCERDIMSKLGFCLARPIPLCFLRRFIKVGHGTLKQHHLAKYLVELGLVEYSTAHYRPSELAAAAICLSFYLLSNKKLEDIWTPTLRYYAGYTLEHIDPIIRQLAKLVVNVEKSKFKAVYNKYTDAKLAKVSCLPQLKGETINELIKTPPTSC